MKKESSVRIFISYRRNGAHDYAESIDRNIATFSKKYGYDIDVFWDIESLKKFTGTFSEAIDEELDKCNVFLLLLSKNCLQVDPQKKPDFYINEILRAHGRQKQPGSELVFLPVFCNGFSSRDIPASSDVAFLQNMEAIDVSGVRGADFVTLFFPKLCEKLMSRYEAFENLYHRLAYPVSLQSRFEIEATYPLQERLNDDVVSVDVCAIAANMLLNTSQWFFENVQCPVRVVICDHTQQAVLHYANQVLQEGDEEDVAWMIRNTHRSLRKLTARNHFIQAKVIDLPLTAAIFIIKYKNTKQSTIKVDYYDFNCNDGNRRSVMIPWHDTENFSFYENQFESIWNYAQPLVTE